MARIILGFDLETEKAEATNAINAQSHKRLLNEIEAYCRNIVESRKEIDSSLVCEYILDSIHFDELMDMTDDAQMDMTEDAQMELDLNGCEK